MHWPAGADLGHRCSGGIARLVTVPPTIPNLWSAGSALLHGASQPSAGQRLTRPPSSRPGSGPRWRCTRRPLGGRCGASVLPSGIEDLPRGLDRTPAAGLIFSRRQSAACVVLRLRLRLRARHLGRLLGRLPPPRRDLPAQPAVAGDGHRWGYGPGGLMHPVATLSISAPADLTRAEAGTRWPMQEFLRPAARPRAGSRSVTQDLEPMIIGERSARFWHGAGPSLIVLDVNQAQGAGFRTEIYVA